MGSIWTVISVAELTYVPSGHGWIRSIGVGGGGVGREKFRIGGEIRVRHNHKFTFATYFQNTPDNESAFCSASTFPQLLS